MTGRGCRCLDLIVCLLVIGLLTGGCHRQATPDAKQARLIAAESMQLKQQLADCNAQIDELKAKHAKGIEKRDRQLDACRARIEVLEADIRQGVAERVNSVTATVVDENAGLRREVRRLRAEIEKLKSESSPTP